MQIINQLNKVEKDTLFLKKKNYIYFWGQTWTRLWWFRLSLSIFFVLDMFYIHGLLWLLFLISIFLPFWVLTSPGNWRLYPSIQHSLRAETSALVVNITNWTSSHNHSLPIHRRIKPWTPHGSQRTVENNYRLHRQVTLKWWLLSMML